MAQQRTQIWKHHNEALISLARTIDLPLYPPPHPLCAPHTTPLLGSWSAPVFEHFYKSHMDNDVSRCPKCTCRHLHTHTSTHTRTVAHKCCPCGHRAKKPILAARIPARSNVWCILKQAPSAFLGAFARAARGAKGRRGGEPGARSVWSIGAGPELSSWSSCSIQVVVACN